MQNYAIAQDLNDLAEAYDVVRNVVEGLPHGSGIDCDWQLGEFDGFNLSLTNSYHAMDNGMYWGYVDFTVFYVLTGDEECVFTLSDVALDHEITEEQLEECEGLYGLQDYLFGAISQ